VLLAVLIVIVVLSLAAYRYSDMMLAEYRATDRILKNAEAKALADSGIHYAAAILTDPNAMTTIGSNPYNNSTYFQNVAVDLGNGKQGFFSVVTPAYAQNQTSTSSLAYNYGVVDEGSKLNVNALVAMDPSQGGVAYNALISLPNMTDQIAYSIIDWIDTDDNTSPGGAEDDYYMGLNPPYHCKNGPLNSIEELLLVQGVTPWLLFGDDLNRNGQQDANETASQGAFSFGWAPYITIYSHESNNDPTGNPRVYVNSNNLQTLLTSLQTALGDNNLAAYIIAYRMYGPYNGTGNATGNSSQLVQAVTQAVANGGMNAKQRISSIWSLLNSQIAIPDSNGNNVIYASLLTSANLSTALAELTTSQSATIVGRINVNTASQTVLNALPQMLPNTITTADVAAIIGSQPDPTTADDSSYQTTAWLYTTAQLTPAKLAALTPYITATSQVYRIQSVGYFDKGGPMSRIEAVVDTNSGYPRFLYYRDMTELGQGIDPRTNQ